MSVFNLHSEVLPASVPQARHRGDAARWALLWAKLDAWFARVYGLTRDGLRYILASADVRGLKLSRCLKAQERISGGCPW